MKLEDQVCSLDLAKKLKDFGVKQDSLFSYVNIDGKGEHFVYFIENFPEACEYEGEPISAFTVAELGEIISKKSDYFDLFCTISDIGYKIYEKYDSNSTEPLIFEFKEADARAKMLIFLIEKGDVKV
jgi:hypothetical protein